ncbi:hypothetical protein B4168_1390 [Anoxybacillus flavithermus]|nr:hypothetical protein B4168_1390 [Anoxybacillus flavithermus]OAO84047.1 hypothetical protein GT23_3582 [Parageobacillus thermoglucosidasius]
MRLASALIRMVYTIRVGAVFFLDILDQLIVGGIFLCVYCKIFVNVSFWRIFYPL